MSLEEIIIIMKDQKEGIEGDEEEKGSRTNKESGWLKILSWRVV